MSPDLARKILEEPVDPDLLAIMSTLYEKYTVQDISRVIAHIRATIVLREENTTTDA